MLMTSVPNGLSKNVAESNCILSKCNSVIDDWSAANILCLNKDKTQSLEFSYNYKNDVDSTKFIPTTYYEIARQ